MARTKGAARKQSGQNGQQSRKVKHRMVLEGGPAAGAAGAAGAAAAAATSAAVRGRGASSGPSQENKLRSVISIHTEPPAGYTFIPVGNPELTAALKEFSRRGDHHIYAVTTTPHAERHELSREVHRVGFHFPTLVVSQVCAHYGIRLTKGGKVVEEGDNDFSKVYHDGQKAKSKGPKDQVTINTEAKQTIKDLFPSIPDNDLFQIIKTAFQLGDNKVGTAQEIPHVRRVQLAVVAHIRHNYTNYDRLLRQMPYNQARHSVEEPTLKKLLEWRGSDDKVDEAAKKAVDEALQEVIIISDEEDSDSDSIGSNHKDRPAVRIEQLQTNAYAPATDRPGSPMQMYRDEAANVHQYIVQPAQRYRLTEDEVAQRERRRYAIWDQVQRDYRTSLPQQPVRVLERIYEPEPVQHSRVVVPVDPPMQTSRSAQYVKPAPARIEYEPIPVRRPSPPVYIRGADGALYERVVRHSGDYTRPGPTRYERTPPTMSPRVTSVHNRPSSAQDFHRDKRHSAHYDFGDDTVLPSIEGPDAPQQSPLTRRVPFETTKAAFGTNSANENFRPSRDAAFVDYGNGVVQSLKRRRVEDVAQSPPLLEYRTARRESPPRHNDHLNMPSMHGASVRNDTRMANVDSHMSPRLRPALADTPRDHRAEERSRILVADPRHPSAWNGRDDHRERVDAHPSGAQHFAPTSRSIVRDHLPPRDHAHTSFIPTGLAQDPISSPHVYEKRTMLDQGRETRREYSYGTSQDARSQLPGVIYREPLEPLHSQRLPEHGYPYMSQPRQEYVPLERAPEKTYPHPASRAYPEPQHDPRPSHLEQLPAEYIVERRYERIPEASYVQR